MNSITKKINTKAKFFCLVLFGILLAFGILFVKYNEENAKIQDKELFDNAIEEKNSDLCNSIRQKEVRDYCYSQLMKIKSSAVCEKIADENWQSDCFYELALGIENADFCKRIKSGNKRNDCVALLEKSSAIESNIENGYVIAYGNFIYSPYEISFKGKTIYINGMQCVPQLRKSSQEIPPTIKPPEISPEEKEMTRKISETKNKASLNYYIWNVQYRRTQAEKVFTDFLKEQETIQDFKFNDSGCLEIKWQGESEYKIFRVDSVFLARSEKEKIEQWIEWHKKIVEDLNSGYLLVFDYNGFKTEIPEGDLTVQKINEIMASNDSQEQKQKKLFEIFQNENAVKSILDNYKND